MALLLPMCRGYVCAWDGGSQIAGAAALAVEKVNSDKSLLPGRRLEYRWADSGCSAKQGLVAMGELMRELGGHINAVIGPGCSSACELTSYLAGGSNTSQISYACTAPSLSNKNEYPLVRLALNETGRTHRNSTQHTHSTQLSI